MLKKMVRIYHQVKNNYQLYAEYYYKKEKLLFQMNVQEIWIKNIVN